MFFNILYCIYNTQLQIIFNEKLIERPDQFKVQMLKALLYNCLRATLPNHVRFEAMPVSLIVEKIPLFLHIWTAIGASMISVILSCKSMYSVTTIILLTYRKALCYRTNVNSCGIWQKYSKPGMHVQELNIYCTMQYFFMLATECSSFL